MKNKQRIDKGNFDLVFAQDDDGRVWVRPSLGWDDGEVYEAFRQRQLIHNTLGCVNFEDD
jgi:hypothetical protein